MLLVFCLQNEIRSVLWQRQQRSGSEVACLCVQHVEEEREEVDELLWVIRSTLEEDEETHIKNSNREQEPGERSIYGM